MPFSILEQQLFLAITRRDAKAVQTLVEIGADPNEYCSEGYNAVHLASTINHYVLEPLLRHGAYVNLIDNSGNTPLHLAAQQDKKKSVRMLLRSGADHTARNDMGVTPEDVARRTHWVLRTCLRVKDTATYLRQSATTARASLDLSGGQRPERNGTALQSQSPHQGMLPAINQRSRRESGDRAHSHAASPSMGTRASAQSGRQAIAGSTPPVAGAGAGTGADRHAQGHDADNDHSETLHAAASHTDSPDVHHGPVTSSDEQNFSREAAQGLARRNQQQQHQASSHRRCNGHSHGHHSHSSGSFLPPLADSSGHKHTERDHLSNELQKMLECSICLDTMTEPITLACGHNFCKGCLEALIAHSGDEAFNCPMDRYRFPKNYPLRVSVTLLRIIEMIDTPRRGAWVV